MSSSALNVPQAKHAETKLRTLGSSEVYFWLRKNTASRTAMILAEVEGFTTVEDWRVALDKVQQRYPLLSVRVRKNPGERPYFESLPDARIPLHVMRLKDVDLDNLISAEPVPSLEYADGFMARVTLCHSEERAAVLFSAYHAISDGITNVQIM